MRADISLRTRIVVLVLVAIVPLFGLSMFKALHNADAELERAKANLQFATSLAAASQERVADSARQVLTLLASLPEVQDGNNAGCDRYFSSLTRHLPEYANLGVLGLDGQTRCHALGSAKKAFLGDRSYFRDAIAQRRFVVGTYAVGRLAGTPVLTFALPVMGADDKVTGVVYASFDLARMADTIAGIQLPSGAALGIQDREGALLAGRPALPIRVGDKVRSPVLQEAVMAMSTGVREGLDGGGHARLWAFMPSSPRTEAAVFVSVSMDRDLIVAPVRRQLWLELAALALVALLGGWIAWMIASRSIVAPARQLLRATRELEKGHLDARVPMRPGEVQSEFSRIAAGFNLMADSLQHRERALENELVRNRQAYAALELTINSMQEGLLAVDAAGRVILVNQTASQLFAIDDSSLVLAPLWPERQGLFVPDMQDLYGFEDLPLHMALRGESGGPLLMLVRNEREPVGRLISCTYRPMQGADGIVGALMVFSDITRMQQLQLEQTRSYEQLSEVQRKLLNAQRLGRIGNWELNLVTGRLWWSDEVYELFGLTRAGFDGRPDTVIAMIHPEDRAGYIRVRDAAMQEGQRMDVEYRILTVDGQTRWIHQLGESHADSSGQIVRRAGVVQDITARKQAELAVARHTELLQQTGEMARIGGWELTVETMTPYWSAEVYRILDLDPSVVLGTKQALDFHPPEMQSLARATLSAALADGTPWDMEVPLVTARGRRIWVRTRGHAMLRDGKVVRLMGVLQDITDQHESQAQLRLLEAAISRLNDIVLITEADPLDEPGPRIVFVNNAFERRTGYSREEALGRSPRFLQGPGTQRSELDRIGAALRKGESVRAELINYKKSGEEIWLDLDMVPIADAQGRVTHIVAIERDITRRKLAEQAMTDSEQRYAALFKAGPVPMWIVDAGTARFLAVNEAAVANYGHSKEEFLQLTLFDIRSGTEQARLKQHLDKGIIGQPGRWLHLRKDGVEFPVETVARAITYMGREARFAVALDITAQVRAEKEVQDYLFTLQRAADATHAITRHRTVEATLQETVDQVRSVVGAHQAVVSLTVSGAQTRTVNAVSHSDKYAHCRDLVRWTHRHGLDAAVCETNRPMRLTRSALEADPHWVGPGDEAGTGPSMRGWLAVPLTGQSGENIGLLQLSDKYDGEFTLQDQYVGVELAQLASIAIENTQLFEQVQQLNQGLEEKVVERTAALARQEALFRALAEQAPQIIWNVDVDGKVTYLNRKWYELMGGTPADWMGYKWSSVVHPDDLTDMSANWKMSRQSLTSYVGMRRLRAADGTYHTMSYRASPVLDDEGGVLFWVGIDADVTEIKDIETALRLSNQELEAFSYSVSHDLRSPLNTVDGFSRLLAKQLNAGSPNEKIQHYLSRIHAGVAQMGRLIEDLLSLAQVSRMQLRHETVDLSAMAAEIAGECQGRNPERVASIHIEEGLQVQGDGRLIHVVMENLLGNAWKFSSRQAHAAIRVGHTTDAGGLSVFFVQDNGAGFDMAYADKLFNTFQRLHAVTDFPGTGVGLATVSRVIGRHGGKVWAQAEPGKGATFFFTLPGGGAAA
ncbi:MAG: PAS domain S-box protein [Polaromonas sp.]|uniref:PAS domain S-box protein n=1 Tax=Polaromonas sp. TaxID=1869339 RepID=UPI00248A12C4|nr:PAS domain S-box protein [Polaromonas sp.]MDI1268209.1 PAS domain S-box protein [Polaromonas sp.]